MGQAVNNAGSGPKWLDVTAERFPGWISSFGRRHGEQGSLGVGPGGGPVTFTAEDGAVAECHPPFSESFAVLPESASPEQAAAAVAAHARMARAVGVLLVQIGRASCRERV